MYSAHCICCLLLAQLFLAGAPWCYRILLMMHHDAIESCLCILIFPLFLASLLVLKDIYVGIDWFYGFIFCLFSVFFLFFYFLGSLAIPKGMIERHITSSQELLSLLLWRLYPWVSSHQQATLEGYTFSDSWLPLMSLPARIQATMVLSAWSFLWSHGHCSTCLFFQANRALMSWRTWEKTSGWDIWNPSPHLDCTGQQSFTNTFTVHSSKEDLKLFYKYSK